MSIKEIKESYIFFVYDALGVKLLARLRLQFKHLNKRIFKYGFRDIINHVCACGAEVKTTEHFLLPGHFYSTQRSELCDQLEKVNSILKLSVKILSLLQPTTLKQLVFMID